MLHTLRHVEVRQPIGILQTLSLRPQGSYSTNNHPSFIMPSISIVVKEYSFITFWIFLSSLTLVPWRLKIFVAHKGTCRLSRLYFAWVLPINLRRIPLRQGQAHPVRGKRQMVIVFLLLLSLDLVSRTGILRILSEHIELALNLDSNHRLKLTLEYI